jgi:hypothetical protein
MKTEEQPVVSRLAARFFCNQMDGRMGVDTIELRKESGFMIMRLWRNYL